MFPPPGLWGYTFSGTEVVPDGLTAAGAYARVTWGNEFAFACCTLKERRLDQMVSATERMKIVKSPEAAAAYTVMGSIMMIGDP